MCCKNFISRAIPFLITFSVGLLIASFFVPIIPRYNLSGYSYHNCDRNAREFNKISSENQKLKNRIIELESSFEKGFDVDAPPPAPKPKAYSHHYGDAPVNTVGYGTGDRRTKK